MCSLWTVSISSYRIMKLLWCTCPDIWPLLPHSVCVVYLLATNMAVLMCVPVYEVIQISFIYLSILVCVYEVIQIIYTIYINYIYNKIYVLYI